MQIIKTIKVSVLFFLILATTSFSQSAKLYLNGGVSLPSSPEMFSDFWGMGYNIGGGIGFSVSPVASIQGYLDYNNFPLDEEKFLATAGVGTNQVSIDGFSASVLSVGINAKINIRTTHSIVSPYFIAGAGYYKFSISDVTFSGSGGTASLNGDSESAFSANVGAGLDFRLSPIITLFIDGRYQIGFTEGDNTSSIPVRSGLAFSL